MYALQENFSSRETKCFIIYMFFRIACLSNVQRENSLLLYLHYANRFREVLFVWFYNIIYLISFLLYYMFFTVLGKHYFPESIYITTFYNFVKLHLLVLHLNNLNVFVLIRYTQCCIFVKFCLPLISGDNHITLA